MEIEKLRLSAVRANNKLKLGLETLIRNKAEKLFEKNNILRISITDGSLYVYFIEDNTKKIFSRLFHDNEEIEELEGLVYEHQELGGRMSFSLEKS